MRQIQFRKGEKETNVCNKVYKMQNRLKTELFMDECVYLMKQKQQKKKSSFFF